MWALSMHILANVAAAGAPGAIGVAEWLNVAQWVFNLIFGGLATYLATQRRRIDTLESSLQKNADERVDTKVGAIEANLETSLAAVARQMVEIKQRLDRYDEVRVDQVREDGQQELRWERELRKFSEFVSENCASRRDVEALSHRFDGLQQAVARAMAERAMAPTERGLVGK